MTLRHQPGYAFENSVHFLDMLSLKPRKRFNPDLLLSLFLITDNRNKKTCEQLTYQRFYDM